MEIFVPAWWRRFLFRTLNGRQLSVYFYLLMLMGDDAACSPTVEEIAAGVGLTSTTMVFDAMNVLETRGFIIRSRAAGSNLRSRRNVYQRPSSEYTILRLLEAGVIDETLSAKSADGITSAGESNEALRSLLGERYILYATAPAEHKRDELIALLKEIIYEADILTA